MTTTEPTLPLPDRFTVCRRIGFLTRELRIARRALSLVEAAHKNSPARPSSEPAPLSNQAATAGGQQ